jgi:hypothetical protein
MATNWASLSKDIVFEPIQGPGKMTRTPTGANWVEQGLLAGKPRMAKIGLKLQEINMTVRFHSFIKPFNVLKAALEDAYQLGTVLQWVYGTGEALGDFIIFDMKYTAVMDSPLGLGIAMDVDISLKEYAGPGVADVTGIDAKKRAYANRSRDIVIAPSMVASTTQQLSASLTTIKQSTAKIKKHLNLLQSLKTSMAAFKRAVVPLLAKIQTAKNTADTMIAVGRNIRNAPNLSTALSNVGVAAGSAGSTIGALTGNDPGSISAAASVCNNLSNVVGSAGRVAQPMQGTEGWWKTIPYLQ